MFVCTAEEIQRLFENYSHKRQDVKRSVKDH